MCMYMHIYEDIKLNACIHKGINIKWIKHSLIQANGINNNKKVKTRVIKQNLKAGSGSPSLQDCRRCP